VAAELLAHGLLRASFVPDLQTQEMRTPASHAQAIGSRAVEPRAACKKTLEVGNITLGSVLANLMGKSGRRSTDQQKEALGQAPG
jgi:transposase